MTKLKQLSDEFDVLYSQETSAGMGEYGRPPSASRGVWG